MRTARLEIRRVSESDRNRFVGLFLESSFYGVFGIWRTWPRAANLRFDHMLALSADILFCKQAIIETVTGMAIGYVGVDYFEVRGEQRLKVSDTD